MKVNEAKEKICPFMSDNIMSKDSIGNYNSVSYCICNDCMAWKYTKVNSKEVKNKEDFNNEELKNIKMSHLDNIVSYTGKDVFFEELPEDEKQGYCQRLNND